MSPHSPAYPAPGVAGRPFAPAAPVGRARPRVRRSSPQDTLLRWFIYFAWFHSIYDPHRWIGFGRSESILLILVAGVAVLQALRRLDRTWKLFVPVLFFLLACLPGMIYAPVTGMATELWLLLFQFYVLGIATILTISSVRQMVPLLLILFFQFPWWLLHGMTAGLVWWHQLLGDENAFAAVMVMGMAWGFHLGRASNNKLLARVMTITAGLCIVGLVASLARGAFLSAIAVAGLTLMRSPKKVQTTLGLVGAGLVLSLASEVMMPGGGFWSEMATTFEEGASEGTTGQDRLVVWGAAAKVWTQHPIVGVGLANFGPYASGYFQYGELEGMYADPRTIFLKAVHNDPVQLLAETGLLGLGLYCAMLVLFFQKANRLRRPAFRRAWQNETGGLFKLEHVSFGFEGAMVALLLNGLFYPQLDRIWFWGLLVFMWIIYHHLEGVVRRERQLQQRVAYGGG